MSTPTSHFALAFNPFDKQEAARADCFRSHDYLEMTGGLGAVTRARGVGLFTAPPGGGKTRVLRDFVQGLNPNLHRMSYICLSTVSIAEFYKQLCDILGVPARGGKPSMFKSIQEQIIYLYKEKRQPLLLAIDECQYLNTAILNDLKMLMNYEYDSLNCFTLILCGETHFISTLRRPVHEALRQRMSTIRPFHEPAVSLRYLLTGRATPCSFTLHRPGCRAERISYDNANEGPIYYETGTFPVYRYPG